MRHVEREGRTLDLLRDLFRHSYNKRGFFYLPKNAKYGIEEESVVDLRVMFTVHRAAYPDLLRARRGAITDLYAAQLGHIVGHMFSRIALPGWEELHPGRTLTEYAKDVFKPIRDREKETFLELSKVNEICTWPGGCNTKAATYRWLPVEEVNNDWRYEPRVLCANHVKEYERQRDGKALGT